MTKLRDVLPYRPRVVAAGLLAILAAPLVGCVDSRHPVSTAAQATADASIFGAWRVHIDDRAYLLVIGRPGEDAVGGALEAIPDGLMSIGVVTIRDPEGRHVVEANTFPATATAFLNADGKAWGVLSIPEYEDDMAELLPARWDTTDAQTWLLLKYQIAGDRLRIWLPSTSKFKTAIERGELEGRTGEEADAGAFAQPVLTASPQRLRIYLAGGGSLFEEEPALVLERSGVLEPATAANGG
ncbi:MAG: hypothetical protein ACIAS6_06250 [Phycisphaerales bacterium JB060]